MKEANITITRVTRKYDRATGEGYWGITGTGRGDKVWFRSDASKVTQGSTVKVRYATATVKPSIIFLNRAEIVPFEAPEVARERIEREVGAAYAPISTDAFETYEDADGVVRRRAVSGTPAEAARGVGMMDCEEDPGNRAERELAEIECREPITSQAGATIVFKAGVSVEAARAALARIADVLENPYSGDVGSLVKTFNPEHGGPVFYTP